MSICSFHVTTEVRIGEVVKLDGWSATCGRNEGIVCLRQVSYRKFQCSNCREIPQRYRISGKCQAESLFRMVFCFEGVITTLLYMGIMVIMRRPGPGETGDDTAKDEKQYPPQTG